MSEVPHLYIRLLEVGNLNFSQAQDSLINCSFTFEKRILKSSKREYSKQIKWEKEEFLFLVHHQDSFIGLTLNYHNIKKEIPFGKLKIPLSTLSDEKSVSQIFSVESIEKKDKKPDIVGKIHLQLHYSYSTVSLYDTKKEHNWRTKFPEVIDLLCSNNYELLNAFCDVVHSGAADKTALTLVHVLMGFGKALDFIKFTINRETNHTNNPQQLFRTNSIATKMMTIYSKLIGEDFLVSCLKKPIGELFKLKTEIKIRDKNEKEKSLEILGHFLKLFFNSIFKKILKCPIEIQEICHQLNTSVQKKFSGYGLIAVSGFLFLRFFSPAITSLDSDTIISEAPTPLVRKNAVIIAKVIQKIANHLEPGNLERDLDPLNDLGKELIEKLDTYLEQISRFSEFKKSNVNQNFLSVDFHYLLDLHNLLKDHQFQIDAVLTPPVESEEDNQTSSLLSFLTSKDPATILIIQLNEFGNPPEPSFKKSHTVSGKIIQKRKAIKINEDTDVIKEQEEDANILNKNSIFAQKPRDPNIVSETLLESIYEIYQNHELDDLDLLSALNTENFHFSMFYSAREWDKMKNSKAYQDFVLSSIGEINSLDVSTLDQDQRLAFWINIYNTLFIHGCIENGGPPLTHFQLKQFKSEFKYIIGDAVYSCDDIMEGVLRGNPKSFLGGSYFKSQNDPRYHVTLQEFSPLVHFAITDLRDFSPEVKIYHAETIQKEMMESTRDFLENSIKIENKKIILPTLFKFFRKDFGKTESSIIEFICVTLLFSKSSFLEQVKLLKESNFVIEFKNPKKDQEILLNNQEKTKSKK
ncbi:ras gtpase-activating protein [Anaeramoeba ignava]|uniref:Ras gtpase-activating protein n=1 Tax=Anaeramoeba ignava TaxID=1746090 RepID=A0A9Q0LB30_ANAIG|nr:ras gtpase-activating protein [Anaeramoeba ignava]